MPRAPYPLEPVEGLRAQARDAAALELGAVGARLQAAQDALTAARAVVDGARQARDRFAREAPAQTDGAALQREARYAARLQQELENAGRGVEQAEAELEALRRDLATAQDGLARAEADRAVLARDHARHDAGEQRRRARAEELEQEDLESLRRGRGLPRR